MKQRQEKKEKKKTHKPKTIAKINETKRRFLEKVNKIDKPLARFIKKKGLISIKLEMKKKVTTDSTEIHSITRDYYKQLYANKMDNLETMDKFLERFSVPRLNQEEIKKCAQTNHKH